MELYRPFATMAARWSNLPSCANTLTRSSLMSHALFHSFLCGESYTVADACITPIIVRLEDLGMDGLMAQHPRLRGWYKRIQARPSFADAYYSGSRLNSAVV